MNSVCLVTPLCNKKLLTTLLSFAERVAVITTIVMKKVGSDRLIMVANKVITYLKNAQATGENYMRTSGYIRVMKKCGCLAFCHEYKFAFLREIKRH
jgi:hypothetical protein